MKLDTGERPAFAVVGAGRAGSALAVALADAGYRVIAVASRTPTHGGELAARVGAELAPSALAAMRRADISLLAVPDSAIPSVAATVAASGAALRERAAVHCSARLGRGALAALRLTGADTGVLHPLQALAGPESAPLLRGAYFRVDAVGWLASALEGLVTSLGGRTLRIPAAQLDLYHAAAVLAGNAPLALLARATSLLMDCGIPAPEAHAALATLLHGAASNARREAPGSALTGPIVRGDAEAVAAHLRALTRYPEAQDIYARLVEEMQLLLGRRPETLILPTLPRVA